MKVISGDLLTIRSEKYLVLDVMEYGGEDYAFSNKMIELEQPTKDYCVFKLVGEGVIRISDNKVLDVLLPRFSSSVQKMVDSYIESVNQ